MRKLGLAAAALAVILFGPMMSQGAHATASTSGFHARVGRFLGVVPTLNQSGGPVPVCPPLIVDPTGLANCVGHLYYNGGPVQLTSKVYTIYWVPRTYYVSINYVNLINQYFKDVQADQGRNSNVYGANEQYYQDHNGISYIQNNTTFEGSIIDTNPLPPLDPTNCPDAGQMLNGTNSTPTIPGGCVTDQQLQQEISSVIKANNLPVDQNTEFAMFTAKNVGTCFPITASAGTVVASAPLCSYQ